VPDPSIIVDAGPLVAFMVRQELHHAWVAETMQNLSGPFLTCEPVLEETFGLVKHLPGGKEKFFEMLDSHLLEVRFDLVREQRALDSMIRRYADHSMSLTDACLVRMAELNPGCSVFTLDENFRTYRKNGRQIIPTILPPPAVSVPTGAAVDDRCSENQPN
jgi:predicted nucleic acid-binding protein